MTEDARTEIIETSQLDGGPISEANSDGDMVVQLITPGWGSSGYYSAEVLEAAATNQVWPAGTHMYLDHPSATEEMDRPERSVRDLAAVLTTDAFTTPNGGLAARVRRFGPYKEHLTEMADAIGVSIRATATAERGEAEGRQGPIITELHEGLSVDFVTQAGRGGKVLQVMESALAQEQLPGGHTVDSLRGALRTALADEHGGDEAFVFVRDFDDEVAYFDVDTPENSTTYQQSYTADDNGAVQLQDGPTQVQPRIQYVPVESGETSDASEHTDPPDAGPGETPAAESAADTSTEEADMDGNQGAGGGALTPRQVYEQREAAKDREIAELRAKDRARSVIAEEMSGAFLANATITRLCSELLESLPLVNNELDESALRDRCTQARDRAEAEAAEVMQAAGMGQPRALGQSTPQGGDVTNLDERLESAFRGMGLGESVAKTAAEGR